MTGAIAPDKDPALARAQARRVRADLLLNYAASTLACERAAAIVDIEGLKGVICSAGGKEIFRTLTEIPADERTIARIIRDGLCAQFGSQAAVFRRLAQDEHGVTAAELAQAVRDYELIAAQRAPARRLAAQGDE